MRRVFVVSGPLWHRPPPGKKWSVDGPMMDRIEAEIAAEAVKRAAPGIARRAIEDALPELTRQLVEATRKQAQADVDRQLPAVAAEIRKQALSERRPGTHREFVPERDKQGLIARLVERWVPDTK